MTYSRAPFYTTDAGALCEWINRELALIEDELKKLEMVTYNVEPSKPFEGMLVIADGTNWNPGSGQGVYWFDGTSWNFLG